MKRTYICDICASGKCELSFEECGNTPKECPFDNSFGLIKWELVKSAIEEIDQEIIEKQ